MSVTAEVRTMKLQARDRCDRCGAQAYVIIALAGSTLMFCAHDFNKHEAALKEKGARILLDEREFLNARSGEEVR